VNTSEPAFRSHYDRAYALVTSIVAEQKISEKEKMKKNIITTKKSGRSADIPTEVPEPDQVAPGKGMPVLENTKIERLDQRLGKLEERERSS
jgi:hypothetical protein